MDSAPSPLKNANTTLQLCFKPLKQIYNARSDPQNVDSSISAGFKFYKSVILNDKAIFFGKPGGILKGSQVLRAFDLKKLQWSEIKVIGSSSLADNREDYSVCVTESNEVVLYGHYPSNMACVETLSMTESGGKLFSYFQY